MIITLTINPAIDRTVSVDKLVFEDRAYILDRTEAAGGRGINASRVIHSFGGKTLALLTCGGSVGERMSKSLGALGFPFEVVRVKQDSRVNITISDKQGLTIKLNEFGAPLEKHELKEIHDLVEARLAKAHWIMICGSIPPRVAPHFYCEIIHLAKKRGVKTLLDTEGDALLHALEAKPTVITPNQHEAERLLGRALITRSQCLEALERVQKMGPESVILSLGSRGAMGSGPEGVFEALPPHIDALCPIGAGDAMAAAFTWCMEKKKTFAESLRWGVAAGTAKAKLPGMTFPTLEQTRAVYKQVELKSAG
ncbi:MAG: 1-phosphofructokinase family hexose kinase [Acidobacteriia bacterium]|nr:1-phosphofructokinase family hexose kinase [Terriglobia bacterium]